MKKTFICIILVLCLLGATACGGGLDTEPHRTWLETAGQIIETLTYNVARAPGLGTGTGTYVMRARKISTGDSATIIDNLINLQVIDINSKSVSELSGTDRQALIQELDEKGGYILTSTLEFTDDDGTDEMYTEIILSSTFHPLALFKSLTIGAENDQNYDGVQYVSYSYSAKYVYNSSAKLQNYTAKVLRRTGYDSTKAYTTSISTFDANTNVWDANQIIYLMRSLKYTQSNFVYGYSEPAPLDSELTVSSNNTALKQMSISCNNATTDVSAPYKGKVSCYPVTLLLSDISVQGKTATVYFAAGDYDYTYADGVVTKIKNLPAKIEQGDYVYVLSSVNLNDEPVL